MTEVLVSNKGPPAEDVLLAYVERLAESRAGFRAIIFHLSRLSASLRDDKPLRVATNILMEVVDKFTGRLFVLRGRDVVIVCKGLTAKAISEAAEALCYLFSDGHAKDAIESILYTVYDLEIGYPQFLKTIRDLRDAEARQLEKKARAQVQGRSLHRRVSDLIDAMSGIDLSNTIQRQTAWSIVPGKKPQPKFDELFVSIERLQRVLDADFEITKDRQLFQYLTQWLDKYVLTRLAWEQFGVSRPVSVNINLATLHSAEFLKFDNERASGWRGRTIFEVQLSDVWSDVSAYLAIADLVKQRGYFRCFDGVKHDALPCLNLQNLKVDLVKILWDDALLQLDGAARRNLSHAINEFGSKRFVLIRCASKEAIQVGHSLGIHLFQGWYCDRLIEMK